MTRHYPKLLIAIFLGMLLLPLRTLVLDPYAIEENFYARSRLIALTSNLRLTLGDRVFPKVLVGDDGWLVYTAEGDLDVYQKSASFTEESLAQFQANLDSLSSTYAERGITLIVVIVPSKNTIYPERVPAQIPQIGSQSKLDQVAAYLSTHGETQILDLRPALLQAKTEREIYLATDTHWNDYGAYLAYSLLMERLSETHPNLSPRPLSDFAEQALEPEPLDLANVIGVTSLTESKLRLAPKFDLATSYKTINLGGRKLLFSYNPDETLPNLVIYHDSYFFNVNPMLGEHFHHGMFIQNFSGGGIWNLSWVDEQKPDVVVIEFAERYLDDLFKFIDPNR